VVQERKPSPGAFPIALHVCCSYRAACQWMADGSEWGRDGDVAGPSSYIPDPRDARVAAALAPAFP
jgi:hypothetical protein